MPRRPAHRLPILACALPLSIAASGSADTITLVSSNPTINGRFGDCTALIGDINNDGYNDVLVGGPLETPSGTPTSSGRAIIFSGRTGSILRNYVSPTPTASGHFGQCAIGFPDLNGDGVDDYAIGAPREANAFGRLYVFSGATGAVMHTIVGTTPTTFTTVAMIPDCTGDGLPEVIGGIFGNASSLPAVIHEAKNGNVWKQLLDPAIQPVNLFGKSVAGVPDVTGDGLGDVLVGAELAEPNDGGAPTPTDAGRVYVYSGATGALYATLWSHDQTQEGHFGQSLAGLPDIDGDGRGEIVVGAPYESAANGWDGRVHIHSGATGAWIRTIVSSDPAPYSFTSGEFGMMVRGTPDLDGDGKWDVVVGAPEEVLLPVIAGKKGRAYSYSSVTGSLIRMFESPQTLSTRFGHALDASRDINGNASPDLVVGAPESGFGTVGPVGYACLFRLVPGDGCTSNAPPIRVSDGTHPFTTVGAALDFPLAPLCGADEQFLSSDVFFEYIASCDGSVTVTTCGSADFDTTIAIYEGCGYGRNGACDSTGLIACNADDPACPNGASTVVFSAHAGACFRIRIGGPGGGSGTFTVSCAATCSADLNGDGKINATDLAVLLGAWGSPGAGDLDGSGAVNAPDIAILLGAWGEC